ncbi:MAG: hypothetical protein HC897_17385 [Thermoanaerobaculia bacterium]|nr:hypothetical protein [Thermoanaerobaculia bacterium]
MNTPAPGRTRADVLAFACSLTLFLTAPTLSQTPPASLGDAIKGGKPKISLRYRLEGVSEDAFDKDALASTLRTTLGYSTLPYKGWSVTLEAENVAVIGNDELYANRGAGDLSNRVFDRPVIADPALTQLSQVYLRYQTEKTTFDLGRREVNVGDERFIGGVGWRQNHQELDSFGITTQVLPHTKLSYLFINKVHRIFGDSQPMASHYLGAGFAAGGAGELTLYGLLLDYDEPSSSRLSSLTYGAELVGARTAGGWKWLWELELAQQDDAGDNPRPLDASYLHALAGVKRGALTFRLGWEVLAGNPTDGQFQTPLATLHKWNGWADKFLSTPLAGLEDLYLSVSGTAGVIDWTVVAHDFQAETGGASYGTELDLQLLYKTSWKQSFGLKAALYDADRFSSDTEKLILWTGYSF